MNSYITKYEASLILGIRMNQLSGNAPILTNSTSKNDSLLRIAAIELLEHKLNLNISRPLPHNKFFKIHVSNLKIPEDVHVLLETFTAQE